MTGENGLILSDTGWNFTIPLYCFHPSTPLIVRLLESAERDAWAKHVHTCAGATLWQSPAWAAYQEALGRTVRVHVAEEDGVVTGSAMVAIDETAGGFSTWDIPRGPIGAHREAILEHILHDAKKGKCLAVFCSPPLPLATPYGAPSRRHEQPEATRILNLTLDDNALLAQMKPKGRYNISVARRFAIDVQPSTDIDAFHALLAVTGGRDGFAIGPKARYRTFLEEVPGAFLLLAYHTSESVTVPVSGLLGAVDGQTGIYYYGASSYAHRQLMAPYLLQWEAMQHCKAQGCTRYDLLGVAPPDASSEHPWAGITNFKEKFGGDLVTYPRERCITLRPFVWWALQMKRKLLG